MHVPLLGVLQVEEGLAPEPLPHHLTAKYRRGPVDWTLTIMFCRVVRFGSVKVNSGRANMSDNLMHLSLGWPFGAKVIKHFWGSQRGVEVKPG